MKSFSEITLDAKLRLIIVSVTGALLVLSSTISIAYLTYDSFRASENYFTNHTNIVASNLSAALAFDDEIGTQSILNTMAEDIHIIAALVTDVNFNPLARLGDSQSISPRLTNTQDAADFPNYSGLRAIFIANEVRQGNEILGYLFVVADHNEVVDNFLNQVFVTVVILLLIMLLVIPISRALAKSFTGPINSLAKTMLVVSDNDDFGIRAEKESADEIGYLVDQFNTMLGQIEERDQRLHDYSHELENFITELEKTKEAAVQASEVKSQFLANMSHEIRTPMNGVVGMLDLLKDCTISSEQRDYVEVASTSATGLLSIINDILDLSKIEAGKMSLNLEPAIPGEVVEEVINILHQVAFRKNIQLICVIEPSAYESASIDPTRLRQVLLNLIGNSVKFTHEGYVRVDCSVSEAAVGSTLSLSVSDTGIGISKENYDRLFEAFDQADGSTTRQYGGTGLGLTICRQVVNLMGGTIQLESEINKGSTFSFDVPIEVCEEPSRLVEETSLTRMNVALNISNSLLSESVKKLLETLKVSSFDISTEDSQIADIVLTDDTQFEHASSTVLHIVDKYSTQTKSSVIQEITLPLRLNSLRSGLMQDQSIKRSVVSLLPHNLSNAKVLLVEDNAINQMVAAKMLEKFGIQCDKAEDGIEAVEKAAKSHYDLILMDCQMPNMDGFEATAKIREHQRSASKHPTPIVALTANAMEEDEKRCLDAGMDDYLAKPIESSLMKNKLDRWLNTPSSSIGSEKLS